MTWRRNGNKFNAKKTTWQGIVFDSAHECGVYQNLALQAYLGELVDVQRQVRIPLEVNGVKVCDLVADFVYTTKAGEVVVADAKSAYTRTLPVWRLKKKLHKAIYGVEIQEL